MSRCQTAGVWFPVRMDVVHALLIIVAIVAMLAIGVTIALLFARERWRVRTAELAARTGACAASPPKRFFMGELATLPAPVQRYLRIALHDGQPLVRRMWLRQAGEFLVKPASGGWAPFTAVQIVGVNPAVFVWDARIRMAPGMDIWVRDGFADGRGHMHASLLAAIPMIAVEGTPGMAGASLQRYLAEAAWFPTALLPSAGVTWEAIDASTARATLRSAGVRASLEFRFGADGLVESVYAAERARNVNGQDIPTPWEGRWFEYEERAGMCIPARGEAAWLLPDGPQVYWKGRLTDASCD